jgi:hypothetical protein
VYLCIYPSPALGTGGRGSYDLRFVDYENESTDGDDGDDGDVSRETLPTFDLDRVWHDYWDNTLSPRRVRELNHYVVDSGGLELHRVRELPVKAYDAHAESGGTECSVCLDDFKAGSTLLYLPCGHQFHPGSFACCHPIASGSLPNTQRPHPVSSP